MGCQGIMPDTLFIFTAVPLEVKEAKRKGFDKGVKM